MSGAGLRIFLRSSPGLQRSFVISSGGSIGTCLFKPQMLQTLRHDVVESVRCRIRLQIVLPQSPFLVHVADAVTEHIQLQRLLLGQAFSVPVLFRDFLHHIPGVGVDEVIEGIDTGGVEGAGEVLPLVTGETVQQHIEIPVIAALLETAVQQALIVVVQDIVFVPEIAVKGGLAHLGFLRDAKGRDLFHLRPGDEPVEGGDDLPFRAVRHGGPSFETIFIYCIIIRRKCNLVS